MSTQFIKSIRIEWDQVDPSSYVRNIEAIRNLSRLDFKAPVTFFVGENGSGKSTLLEAIAVSHGFNPEGGSINYHFSTRSTHSELFEAVRISKGTRRQRWGYFLRAESFYNVATMEEDYVDGAHPSARYHEQSHGESSCTCFRITSIPPVFISWMNRKPLFHRRGN